jgi:hypothetical protein
VLSFIKQNNSYHFYQSYPVFFCGERKSVNLLSQTGKRQNMTAAAANKNKMRFIGKKTLFYRVCLINIYKT